MFKWYLLLLLVSTLERELYSLLKHTNISLQILNPIKTRFLAVIQAPMFQKECQHEAYKEEVERLLQCFRGAAEATDRRNVSFLFSFLVPVLEDCVPLFELYHNCSETVEILLSLLLDIVDSQLGFLTKVGQLLLCGILILLYQFVLVYNPNHNTDNTILELPKVYTLLHG